MFIQVCRTIK